MNWLQCLKNLKQLHSQVQSLLQWRELQTLSLQDEVLRLRSELEREREQNSKLLDLLKTKAVVTSGQLQIQPARSRDAVVRATQIAFDEARMAHELAEKGTSHG